jgi:hypothetical protein
MDTSSSAAINSPAPSETLLITQTSESPSSPSPVSEDSGWKILQSGLERRRILLRNTGDEPVEEITLLRVSPDRFSFDVAYDPQGRKLETWLSETGAEVIVNGGYFRKEQGEYIPDGLIISGGAVWGDGYGDYAGMFAVAESGPELRWLRTKPYDPVERLRAALQCFPMLIKPGGQIGFPVESEDGIRARRSVIGQDRGGRILFLVASRGYFTLRELSVFLHDGDLELDAAMNLDGGPSSGMAVADPPEIIPAESALPIVFIIRPK